MITLYGFGPGFGLPEISAFVTKTEVQLKMAGLAYRKERAMPPASPKGQLPYILDEGERIADSTFIRAHIEGKYGFDFDAPISLQAPGPGGGVGAKYRTPFVLGHGRCALGGSRQFHQGAGAFLRWRAGAFARQVARRRAIPCGRELSVERSWASRARRGRRSRGALAAGVVSPARGQAVFDGRHTV